MFNISLNSRLESMKTLTKIIIGITFIIFVANVEASNTWSKSAKHAYVKRCAESMSLQGLSMKNAMLFCNCTTNGMEAQFGMKEYNHLMKANPNPYGTEYDRRLYNILLSCGNHLPK